MEMPRRLNSKEAQVLKELQKQWDSIRCPYNEDVEKYYAAKHKYEQREREYKALLDEIRRDPRPQDRPADQRQSKDFIIGFNIVGADTWLENNLFNRMEKAKRPYCKLAELIYDDVKACRETYMEVLNYVWVYTPYNAVTDNHRMTY